VLEYCALLESQLAATPLAMLNRKFIGKGLCHSRCRRPSFCWRGDSPRRTESNLIALVSQGVKLTRVKPHHFLSLLLLQIGYVTVGSALPNSDPSPTPSVVIAPDGTVQVTRVVPLPSTISAAARENLVKMKPVAQSHQTLQEHRTETDKWQAERAHESLELYPAKLATDVIAGVPQGDI
jgi:hypothetical protein